MPGREDDDDFRAERYEPQNESSRGSNGASDRAVGLVLAASHPPPPPQPSSLLVTNDVEMVEHEVPLPLPVRFPRAVELLPLDSASPKLYWDRSHYESPEAQVRALHKSSTVYVGNMSFSTRASHVFGFFSSIGPVKAVHMGLDRLKKTPCGFCFVEFWKRSDALASVQYGSGSKLDGSFIRVELDAGFQPGRQYGRGRKGGQVRDDRRETGRQSTSSAWRGGASTKRTADEALQSSRPKSSEQDAAITSDVRDGYPSEPNDDDDGERSAKRQRT